MSRQRASSLAPGTSQLSLCCAQCFRTGVASIINLEAAATEGSHMCMWTNESRHRGCAAHDLDWPKGSAFGGFVSMCIRDVCEFCSVD